MILVIDDDCAIRTSLSFMLKKVGYEVKAVGKPKMALEILREEEPLLILMDMNFGRTTDGEEGLELLKQVKVFRPAVPVVLMTAWGSIGLAVKGMQLGAADFVTKPWNNIAFLERIQTVLEVRNAADGKCDEVVLCEKSETDAVREGRNAIVGESRSLLSVLDTVNRIAKTNAPVLIMGESGTGKELIAEAVHRNSVRSGKPFVKVNLGGISSTLFESEMFGHKKGAFTDAVADRKGRFEMADGGTIFLDEIGELDRSSQVKLLRVLQDQTYEVLGDSRPRRADVRVVCATNADLVRMVREKTFREDLFYRINLITVTLPALRERREDIPLLVRHFIRLQCEENGFPSVEVNDSAIKFLQTLPFPGNIRELKNLTERTLLMSGRSVLSKEDFERAATSETVAKTPSGASTLEALERDAIVQAIEKYDGNLSQVALSLGISRGALYRRIEKHGIRL